MNDLKFQNVKSSPGSHLMNRVVLLVGTDPEILHTLAVEFAAYGSDIALAAPQLPDDIINTIREDVQQLGGRFLLVNKDQKTMSQSGEPVVEQVKKVLGKMDIFIDVSARKKARPANLQPQLINVIMHPKEGE